MYVYLLTGTVDDVVKSILKHMINLWISCEFQKHASDHRITLQKSYRLGAKSIYPIIKLDEKVCFDTRSQSSWFFFLKIFVGNAGQGLCSTSPQFGFSKTLSSKALNLSSLSPEDLRSVIEKFSKQSYSKQRRPIQITFSNIMNKFWKLILKNSSKVTRLFSRYV